MGGPKSKKSKNNKIDKYGNVYDPQQRDQQPPQYQVQDNNQMDYEEDNNQMDYDNRQEMDNSSAKNKDIKYRGSIDEDMFDFVKEEVGVELHNSKKKQFKVLLWKRYL